jgi:hypothetical protein
MSRSASAAAKLPESERKKLAVQALAGSETISELSVRLGVSRKFVYAQMGKANEGLNDAFSSPERDEEVLFQLPVTRTWLRQVMLGLPLICRSSYRGVMEFMRDLLGVTVSIGSVHEVLHRAAQQAGAINRVHTGKAGAGYDPDWAGSSTPSSPPSRRSCNTRRAAVRWRKT